MENPTTWRDCRLSSHELDRTELMVLKVANRIRAVQFYSIRLSGTRRLSPFGRWRETRNALSRFAPFVQTRVLRRHVTFRHRRSFLHGNSIYVA
jgi:hypothetical protein